METTTGSTDSSRVRIDLTIVIESVEFDVEASVIRLKGRNVEETKHVKVFSRITGGLTFEN